MPVPHNYALEITATDAETLVRATGEIDASVSGELREKLVAAATSGPPVIVDLSGVTFCDSSGLTALVHGRTSAGTAGTKFVIATRQRAILRPIALLGLVELLDIQPDVGAARAVIDGDGHA